jgi:hypothetical protein
MAPSLSNREHRIWHQKDSTNNGNNNSLLLQKPGAAFSRIPWFKKKVFIPIF